MAQGKIVKALSGFYYVKDGTQVIQCRGRGNFRKRKITPLVGDYVDYSAENVTDGYVLGVHPRQNELIRPPIANVDQAVLVFSLREPAFDQKLLDRFLVHIESKNIDAVICLNKLDLDVDATPLVNKIKKLYGDLGYPVIETSALNQTGLMALRESLADKISVFAGQSGVGKSSLLNALDPSLNLDTAQISNKLGRGRHTTRHVELIEVEDGLVADTPGFSALDFKGMTPETLSVCFPEMREHLADCKFRGCLHLSEPGCDVKRALKAGELDATRYAHYKQFNEEVSDRRRRT